MHPCFQHTSPSFQLRLTWNQVNGEKTQRKEVKRRVIVLQHLAEYFLFEAAVRASFFFIQRSLRKTLLLFVEMNTHVYLIVNNDSDNRTQCPFFLCCSIPLCSFSRSRQCLQHQPSTLFCFLLWLAGHRPHGSTSTTILWSATQYYIMLHK